MLFFPYRAELEQWRFPFITLMICLACALTFNQQFKRDQAFEDHAMLFCHDASLDHEFRLSLEHISASTGILPNDVCTYMLRLTHLSDDEEHSLRTWAYMSGSEIGFNEQVTREYIRKQFSDAYDRYGIDATDPLTHTLWFDPKVLSSSSMVSSIFAHGDLEHLIINLLFFFAFAATIEMIIGSMTFAATVVLLALLTNSAYAVLSTMQDVFVPTIGLSGVVFGVMGMFVCFLPQARLRCLFWFVIIFKRAAIPAWLFVGGYLCWNIYGWIMHGVGSNVNFTVHVSGAVFGYLIGYALFRTSMEKYNTCSIVRDVNKRYPAG